MNQSAFVGLIQNTALLLGMALLFDLVLSHRKIGYSKLWQLLLGIILGGIGIVLMLTPWVLIPGIIFDTRSILLGISGLFFGPIPTIIAIIMTAAFRIYQGGTATWAGVAVIVSTGTIGILWRRMRGKPIIDYSGWQLYFFGLFIHIVMLLCMFLLPNRTALQVLNSITIPVITIYPLGTMLLGLLMVNQLRRERINKDLYDSEEHLRSISAELQKSEAQYRLLTENIKDVVWILDSETLRFRYVSPSVKRLHGFTAEEVLQNPFDQGFSEEDAENLRNMIRNRVTAFQSGREEPDKFYSDDIQQLCKDGSSIWTEEVTTFYTNPENGHVEILGVSRDISSRKRAEEALLISEKRFRGLAESSQDYIMLYDRECRHVYENPAALKFFGDTEADIIGKTYLEAGFDKNLSEKWEKDVNEVFASGETRQRLLEWDGGDGLSILDWRLSPVFDQNNNVELVLGISRDITDLKKTEKALQRSEEQYRVLTENIKDVVWIIDTETFFYRYISPSVEKLSGFTAEEILQKPVDFAFKQEDADNFKKTIQKRAEALVSGEEAPNRFYIDEMEQPCKDGSMVWTEAVTTYYFNSVNGHVEIRGVSRDISERKQYEATLRESEIYFRQLYEQAPLGYQSLDIDGKIIEVNQAWLEQLGYRREDVIGRSFGDFLVEGQVPLFKNNFSRFKSSGTAHVTFDLVRNDHSTVTYQIDGSVRHDKWGNFKQTQCILTDLTERRKAENKLLAVQEELQRLLAVSDQSRLALLSVIEDHKTMEEQILKLNTELEQRVLDRTAQLEVANKELEAFAYSVSHDLRAPLRAMDGFSSALIMDYESKLDEQGRHYLARIKEASQRMGQLIEDLLNLSRVTRRSFNRERVDLSALVSEVSRELQANEPERNAVIEIEEGIFVQADNHLIRIAMVNLLDNAFKFTAKQKETQIKFGIKKIDDKIVFFVSDNGVGFNMEYAGKLFSPFQRLHTMKDFPGTGVGLVTVQRIIARHGGRIWTEAKEGQGAVFYFTLGVDNE